MEHAVQVDGNFSLYAAFRKYFHVSCVDLICGCFFVFLFVCSLFKELSEMWVLSECWKGP